MKQRQNEATKKVEARKSAIISLINAGVSMSRAAQIHGLTGDTLSRYLRRWREESPELFEE